MFIQLSLMRIYHHCDDIEFRFPFIGDSKHDHCASHPFCNIIVFVFNYFKHINNSPFVVSQLDIFHHCPSKVIHARNHNSQLKFNLNYFEK